MATRNKEHRQLNYRLSMDWTRACAVSHRKLCMASNNRYGTVEMLTPFPFRSHHTEASGNFQVAVSVDELSWIVGYEVLTAVSNGTAAPACPVSQQHD
jgi:hypothetical protein